MPTCIAGNNLAAVFKGDAAGDLIGLIRSAAWVWVSGSTSLGFSIVNLTVIYLDDVGIGDRRGNTSVAGLNAAGVSDDDAAGDLVALMAAQWIG